jgi:predicted DNA-binding transcriptional regulator YafY
MRRADRLFQIIQLLRRRRAVTTAASLAEKLEVSERTIYRDIADLIASGTPIEGEAGVGYRLHADYDLPPLMFDRDEIQALVLGARIVQQFGDAALAQAGTRVLAKVAAAVPKELQAVLNATTLFAPGAGAMVNRGAFSDALSLAREALIVRRKLRLSYRAKADEPTERVVRPLGAFFWGRDWTLAAYCELRADFRNFRLDRVAACTLLEETFIDEPGRTLADMMKRYGPDAVKMLSG